MQCVQKLDASTNPTESFTISKPQNSSIDVFELHKTRWSADFWAIKLWIIQSGTSSASISYTQPQNGSNSRMSTNLARGKFFPYQIVNWLGLEFLISAIIWSKEYIHMYYYLRLRKETGWIKIMSNIKSDGLRKKMYLALKNYSYRI